MDCEVVVVGGGIGGLTVAALLAERGVNVCLLERESRVGGCAASFDKFGYSFEQGDGLYSGWHSNEIYDRLFSELPVDPPEVHLLEPGYVVRLPGQYEIALTSNAEQLEASLRSCFPECAERAVDFYSQIGTLGAALRRALQTTPDFLTATKPRRAYALLRQNKISGILKSSGRHSTLQHLADTSARFRRFVDAQLQLLAQGTSGDVAYLHAAMALSAPTGGMFALRGGANALAVRLAESIKKSGGGIRLDTTVLRLSYHDRGSVRGVDLLSGETVTASKAVVSNLTIWDTYGKLAGLNRVPTEIRKRLSSLRSWGAYLLYLGLDEAAAQSLVSNHLLALTDEPQQQYDPENGQFLFAVAPGWDPRGPSGKRAVTVHTFTEVDEWFTFHKDETELEQRDQRVLERCWERLHSAIPELGGSIEVIDTATPRSFYDLTRRKLGMVGSLTPATFWLERPSYLTSLPNLFIVSDTVYPGGLEGLTLSALLLANKITGK